MMMRGPALGGYAPAMGGYDARRGYNNVGPALRGTRELYDPHRQLHRAGPSAWGPATILGVILLITAMPYMRTPDMATMAYYRQTAGRASSASFSLPLLWIPVVGFIALQFFGASDWYQGVYVGDRYGARPGVGGSFGGAAMAPGGAYAAMSRGGGGWNWPWSGSSSLNQYNYRYNAHQHRGLLSTFMDFGGHWLLILLGIAVFTLVSSSSLPSVAASRVPPVPLAPRMLGFPWSWFF
ncbi:hypothetical protein M758_1G304600 [Ceratodon purpureus]|nr:hypothetical protein M758_1G304600 [Ceratodon purpureus]